MGQHLKTLIELQRQGLPMSPYHVEACRWGKTAAYESVSQIRSTAEGWPIHPTLEAEFPKTPTNFKIDGIKIRWTQINPQGEKEIIEEKGFTLQAGLLWPGGDTFDHLTKCLLAIPTWKKPKPIERLQAYKVFQDLVEKEFGKGTLDVVRRLKGIKKSTAINFLLSNLPEDPEKRTTAITRRNQFLNRNPELVHWMWNEHKALDAKNPIKTEENPPKKATGILTISQESDYLDFTFEGNHTWKEELQELIFQGASDQDITESFMGSKAWSPSQIHTLAKVMQGNKHQCKAWIQTLEARRSQIRRILKECKTPEELQETTQWIYRQNQALTARLKETEKGKISRNIPAESMYHWYRDHETALHYLTPDKSQQKEALQRGDSLLATWTIWKAQATWKLTAKALEKIEAKKPEEERHRILIPEDNHIMDYLQETYPKGPIPANLSPKKLTENIRKWEGQRISKIEEELLKSNEHIPPEKQILYPPTFEGSGFTAKLLTSKHEFELESKEQNHCVRGYFRTAKTGELAIYSITTNKGVRWTLEVNNALQVQQFRGKENKNPSDTLAKNTKNVLAEIFQARNEKEFKGLSKEELVSIKSLHQQKYKVIPPTKTEEALKPLLTGDPEEESTAKKIINIIQSQPKRYLLLDHTGVPHIADLKDQTISIKEWDQDSNTFLQKKEPEKQNQVYNSPHYTRKIKVTASKNGGILLEYNHQDKTHQEILPPSDLPEKAILEARLSEIPEEEKEEYRISAALQFLKKSQEKESRKKPHEVIYFEAKDKQDAIKILQEQKESISLVKEPLFQEKSKKFKDQYTNEEPLFHRCQAKGTLLLKFGRRQTDPEKLSLWENIHTRAKALKEEPFFLHQIHTKIFNTKSDATSSLQGRIALQPPEKPPGFASEFCWVNMDTIIPPTPQIPKRTSFSKKEPALDFAF